MLTVKQPTHYGYKSVHDLPTPPSTSRPSPPLSYQDHPSHKLLPSIPRSHSPPGQPMSTHHRGLPPPAAMTLPPQPPHSTAAPPPPPPPAPQPHQPASVNSQSCNGPVAGPSASVAGCRGFHEKLVGRQD
ncbi:hypothetical protein CGLO_15136 [Colletotrichum gloeosporioides Cg-14]|uniref:Uncharacterized protein n=1 Tax=Colletotrichum gloeosporioides (strain Cg-14) TaxID=1237896 RepID=T0JZD5_COLGC|nr:hypothetical protein CGLO_15136 [Colletotrichum gloeosporioides Cg-14]